MIVYLDASALVKRYVVEAESAPCSTSRFPPPAAAGARPRGWLKWFHYGSTEASMLNLTLKNIPKELHARLRQSAEKNRRSLNSEILARLEAEFTAPVVMDGAQARAMKRYVAGLPRLDHRIGDRAKRKGLK